MDLPRLEFASILVADDESLNLRLMATILQDKYRLHFAKCGKDALRLAKSLLPDLILMDVVMPDQSGYEVCRHLKQDPETKRIPVIFVTVLDKVGDEIQGFDVGAVDYITKPFRPSIVRARVASHLSLVRAEELQKSRLQIVRRLGRAAEYRDNQTGYHVIRMSKYAHLLSMAAGWSERAAEEMLNAAPMHDVGKIGIPDRILLKKDALSDSEWSTMRQHPRIGAEIIGNDDSILMQLSREIALTHHEKWDGSGYPRGLREKSIPLSSRIVAIADVFDALTTERPYKKAWPVNRALTHLKNEAGRHFDPELVPLFLDRMDQVLAIKEQWREDVAQTG